MPSSARFFGVAVGFIVRSWLRVRRIHPDPSTCHIGTFVTVDRRHSTTSSMSEIAELLESALRSNQHVLRQAAMRTVSRLPSSTTIRELLSHEAAGAIRELTLDDLATLLAEHKAMGAGESATVAGRPAARRIAASDARVVTTEREGATEPSHAGSREEQIYRAIVEALSGEPKTIGQLATAVSMDTDELRGYLDWMKRSGRVVSHGRARATRYALA